MGNFSVALGTPADCGECALLLVDQLREHGIEVSPNAVARVLELAIADMRRGFVMVARDGGRLVGVAYVATILSLEHCGPAAWLEELYVAPDWRQRGCSAKQGCGCSSSKRAAASAGGSGRSTRRRARRWSWAPSLFMGSRQTSLTRSAPPLG